MNTNLMQHRCPHCDMHAVSSARVMISDFGVGAAHCSNCKNESGHPGWIKTLIMLLLVGGFPASLPALARESGHRSQPIAFLLVWLVVLGTILALSKFGKLQKE